MGWREKFLLQRRRAPPRPPPGRSPSRNNSISSGPPSFVSAAAGKRGGLSRDRHRTPDRPHNPGALGRTRHRRLHSALVPHGFPRHGRSPRPGRARARRHARPPPTRQVDRAPLHRRPRRHVFPTRELDNVSPWVETLGFTLLALFFAAVMVRIMTAAPTAPPPASGPSPRYVPWANTATPCILCTCSSSPSMNGSSRSTASAALLHSKTLSGNRFRRSRRRRSLRRRVPQLARLRKALPQTQAAHFVYHEPKKPTSTGSLQAAGPPGNVARWSLVLRPKHPPRRPRIMQIPHVSFARINCIICSCVTTHSPAPNCCRLNSSRQYASRISSL